MAWKQKSTCNIISHGMKYSRNKISRLFSRILVNKSVSSRSIGRRRMPNVIVRASISSRADYIQSQCRYIAKDVCTQIHQRYYACSNDIFEKCRLTPALTKPLLHNIAHSIKQSSNKLFRYCSIVRVKRSCNRRASARLRRNVRLRRKERM